MEMREVYSTNVQSIGYEDGNLVVQWLKGKKSVYTGVPPQIADEVMNAPSITSALRASIIGVYPHKYA